MLYDKRLPSLKDKALRMANKPVEEKVKTKKEKKEEVVVSSKSKKSNKKKSYEKKNK